MPPLPPSPNTFPQPSAVTASERAARLGQRPLVLWFTGLSGAGKSALSAWLSRRLHDDHILNYILDGDNLRHGLNRDLSFGDADRHENIRRIAHVAALMYDAGLVTLVACISPFRAERAFARSLIPPGRFVEIFVSTPLHICEQRDTKNLYRRARAGEIANFTGIDSPYQPPDHPEITINTANRTLDHCGLELLKSLQPWQPLRCPPAPTPPPTPHPNPPPAR